MLFKDRISLIINKKSNFIKIKKENIFLNIIFEDSEILIINKPTNFVVHLGYGNTSGTLLNALIFHYPDNLLIPRAGIVHRLDRNTTGILVVAKTISTYYFLINLFKKRKIIKEYDVIVIGRIEVDGKIEKPIKRDIYNRTKMTVGIGGKQAITYYSVITIFKNHTYLRIQLKTGRMHQIRVHLSSIFHPVLGDKIYSKGIKSNFSNCSKKMKNFLSKFNRPALHARMLNFIHPKTNKKKNWIIYPPKDMLSLINVLYSEDMN
ncbi:RluA family pseudouridine synthase [Buchnera aphidicola]|uniref:RluA family pseudouridine synthase n=1 Tax=Buchnera aphidicola TaxID=9 RepID=UPI002E220394